MFSGLSELQFMKTAKEKGYKVNLVYVAVKSKGISVERVAERVSKGGHDVPKEDIERRFERSINSLKRGIKIADRSIVLENSMFGQKPSLLMKMEKGRIKYLTPKPPNWFKNIDKT